MSRLPNPVIHGLAALIALAGGLCLGVVDLQTSEVVMTLGLLFVFNMALGAGAPRGGWYWPFLTAAGILFMNWYPQLVRLPRNPYLPPTFWSYALLALLLLIAGLAGMLFGVVVRRSLHTFRLES